MIQVIAAIIIQGDKVMIARRGSHDALAGKWEFPGGKLEVGETPEECLLREMVEEFSIQVKVLHYFGNTYFEHNGTKMELQGFVTELIEGNIKLHVHDEIKWVKIHELREYDFAPADIPLVEKLMFEMIADEKLVFEEDIN